MTQRLNAVSTQQAVVASLRDRILSGEFAPGSSLSDVALAQEYGVARPTVRAAVQELVHEGTLRREPRRRAFVPRMTAADIADLYFVRTPLELAAVSAVAGRPRALEAAEQALRAFEALAPDSSWARALGAHERLHAAIVAGAGSPRLDSVYAGLQAEMRLALVQLQPAYTSVAALAADHRRFLDGVRSSTPARARALMREHLERAVADLT